MERCAHCHRPIRDGKSMAYGMGPVCRRHETQARVEREAARKQLPLFPEPYFFLRGRS